jgi:hypothetical protein
MWYTLTIECYSAFKWKEILTHLTTWLNHKDIILSEISQSTPPPKKITHGSRYLEQSNSQRQKVKGWSPKS